MIRPLVSFVVPVYDRTDMLRRTVQSLFDQAADFDFEIIVVQDGSPDDTRNTVLSLQADSPVRFRTFSFAEASGTASRGRNLGIVEAKGTYVAFSDSDDISVKHRLQASVDVLRSESLDFVSGRIRFAVDPSREIDIRPFSTSEAVPLSLGLLSAVNPVVPSTVTIKRTTLLLHGGFRCSMRYREDHELWLRLAHRGARMKMVDDVFADYLLHGGNNELSLIDGDEHWAQVMMQKYRLSFDVAEWGL